MANCIIVRDLHDGSRHLKSHSKPHRCETCGKGFALRADLNRHIKARHRLGNTMFKCEISNCESKFARKDNVKRHIQRYHPDLLKPNCQSDPEMACLEANADGSALADSLSLIEEPLLMRHWWQMSATGNLAVLEGLLEAGCDINMKADDGNTALHCAAQTGQSIAVKFLLEHGAYVNPQNLKCRTPLFEAATSGCSETILTLLREGGTVVRFERPYWATGSTPAFVDYIVATGDSDLVQAILDLDTSELTENRDTKGTALAVAAAKIGQISILASLSVSDPKVFDLHKRLRPISFAVCFGHLEAVRTLIAPTGLSERSRCLPGLVCKAAKRGHLSILQLLLESFPGALNLRNSGGWSALQLASSKGHLDSVRYLLSRSDIDVNLRSRYGWKSALQEAVMGKHLDVVQVLLLCPKIDTSLSSMQGTALFLAAKSGSFDVTRALLEHGARDDKALFPTFWTGIHLSRLILQYGGQTSSQVVEEIIESRAQLANFLFNKQKYQYRDVSNRGVRLISLAVKENDVDFLQSLLSFDFLTSDDLNEKIGRHSWRAYRTPLNYARQRGYTEVADLLSAHGATDEVWDPYGKLAIDEKKEEEEEEERAAAAEAAAKDNESTQPAHKQAESTPEASRDTPDVASQEEDDSDGVDAGSELGEEPWSYINECVSPQSNEVDESERKRKRQRQE